MSWSVVDKYVRRITKSNGNARQINIPRSIQNILNVPDVQWVILKNNGKIIVTICGIDDFNNLMNNINKDGE